MLEQEIIGGVVDNGDPAVIAFAENGSALCTATLIGRLTVLTAAHCVDGVRANAQLSVQFGTVAAQATRTIAVTQVVRDPRYNNQQLGHDVGLLRLATPVTDVPIVPINTTPLVAADIGKNLRHVGYGVTDGRAQTGFGTKRQVTLPIRQVNSLELESGAAGRQTCNGDSGGPALMVTAGHTAERVIGITSYGDQNCVQTGFDTRVDTVVDYIRTTAAAWEKIATCIEDGACLPGCAPVDPDCACAEDNQCTAQCADPLKDPDCVKECGANGTCSAFACATPDPDCVATGGACTRAEQCVGKQCVTDPQHPAQYCSQACGADGGAAACPGGMECVAGACKHLQMPEASLGQACSPETFCTGGTVCAGMAGAATLCSNACTSAGACSSALDECVSGANAQRFCRTRLITPPSSGGAETPAGSTSPGGASGDVGPNGMLGEASGCSAVGGGPGLALGLALVLALGRRRRGAW